MKKATPKVDFEKITQQMKGKVVDRPNSASAGTLSGHAAGEPFEKCVLGVLREQYPKKILKQYEFLNDFKTAKQKCAEYVIKYPFDEKGLRENEFLTTR